MPKMKTHRGAAKRFKVTGNGKVRRRKAFASHLMEKKSPKKKRGFSKMTVVSPADERAAKKMLGV